jgi:hypothetical protein
MGLLAAGLILFAALLLSLGKAARIAAARAPVGEVPHSRRTSSSSRASRYFSAFVMGLASPILVCVGAVEALERIAPEHLPPPAISNQISFDEKLLFLRRHPEIQPRILGTGSSSALRTLDGSAFQEPGSAGLSFLNAGLAGGQIHHIRYAGDFFLDVFREVRTVVHVAVPPDFADCSSTDPEFFNAADARSFVLRRMSSTAAYLKYFNPQEIVPEALHIAAERRNWSEGAGSRMYMDAYGTMPMQISEQAARLRHRELYNHTDRMDPRCLEELKRWSRDVAAHGGQLYVVVPPISPLFFESVPGARAYVEEFTAILRDGLHGEPAKLLDARDLPIPPGGFADAYHLQWSAAQLFSRAVAESIDSGVRHAGRTNSAGARERHLISAAQPGYSTSGRSRPPPLTPD